jgi:uncharacterized protein YecT (DUF1311 family)
MNQVDRLLAAALGAADRKLAETAQYGRLLWKTRGQRAYLAFRDGNSLLTLTGPNSSILQYEIVGIDLEELR